MSDQPKWYFHVRGIWPGSDVEHTNVMVATNEDEIRRVWQHYQIISITRGAPAERTRTVEA